MVSLAPDENRSRSASSSESRLEESSKNAAPKVSSRNGRGIVAALALGADGVQMGTVFLACEESGASRLHREALLGQQAGHTSLTRGFTGRLARGIHNRPLEQLNQNGVEILPYPLQRALVRNLATAAESAGRSDLVPLWAGQSAPLLRSTEVTQLLSSLVEEVWEVVESVAQAAPR